MQIDYTVGAELEFYVCSDAGGFIADLTSGKFPQKRFAILDEYSARLNVLFDELKSLKFELTGESGPGQFETQFKPTKDIDILAGQINQFKVIAPEIAAKHQLQISFDAKPLADYCGSGLHIHYSSSLFDPYGLAANNGVMQPKIDAENDYVLWAIGGMLANIPKHAKIFFPNADSRQRLAPYLNAPTKICWGRNNRSCAIRIPDSKPKRIEHRVAGADADAKALIETIVSDAAYGISNKSNPGKPIYGNAWDAQYAREVI